MKRVQAIKLASNHIVEDGYAHGPCLEAVINPRYERETWEIEFAYEGQFSRSLTKDPPSIVVAVESSSATVWLISVM